MNNFLTTGEMIHKLEIGQKAVVMSDGYVGGKVYKYKSPTTGYMEIRWEETDNVLKIGGNMFNSRWMIV